MEQYHNALKKEIQLFAQNYHEKIALDTIYMGGGTPSTYPDQLLLDTFGTLRDVFIFDGTSEITIEVNPGTVRIEQLALWKSLGINRLSIGVQSLKDQLLKKLNRHQSAQDVYDVLAHASKHFENLSVDFILGLPEISPDEWKDLLQKAVTWPINHISIYFLTVHEETPLYFGVQKKKITLPCDDQVVDLYYWSVDYLKQYGFEQYEISNFAKPGFQSRHNTMYWERKPYKAFGLGACEFDGKSRFQNQKNLMAYIHGIERNENITVFSECLTDQQIYLERIMLGLRRTQGVPFQELVQELSEDQKELIKQKLIWLKENQFIVENNDRLALTPKGLAVENDIVIKLSL